MKKNTYRLFFAVELSTRLKILLMQQQEIITRQWGHAFSADSVTVDNFHITLSFLGDVTEKKLENILDGFETIELAPFNLLMGQVYYWPKNKLISCEIKDPEKQLLNCKRTIEKQLSHINHFQFDKQAFQPHITLFRQVETTQPLKDISADITNTETLCEVKTVSLMHSQLSNKGVNYLVIEEWPLLANLSLKEQFFKFSD